jgi:hypothetical protein
MTYKRLNTEYIIQPFGLHEATHAYVHEHINDTPEPSHLIRGHRKLVNTPESRDLLFVATVTSRDT